MAGMSKNERLLELAMRAKHYMELLMENPNSKLAAKCLTMTIKTFYELKERKSKFYK